MDVLVDMRPLVTYKGVKIYVAVLRNRTSVKLPSAQYRVKASEDCLVYEAYSTAGQSFATTPDAALQGAVYLIDNRRA
jgi:hypothetical protein